MDMEYSENFGNLRIYQDQVEGWVTGTYNTFVTYSGEILAEKYHFHETRKHNKENPDNGIYNLLNGQDIIGQCSLCKDILNDVAHLKIKMEAKTRGDIKYNFDIEFVGNVLKNIVDAVHRKIESIYFDLQFEAVANGEEFNIPLPNYTGENVAENCTGNNASITMETKNSNRDETIESIKHDTSLLVEMMKTVIAKETKPEYIKLLIDKGYLYDDGRTVIGGLNETAAEYVRITKKPVVLDFLQNTFFKTGGTKYSNAAYKAARDFANQVVISKA
jgi:hypothetical protein